MNKFDPYNEPPWYFAGWPWYYWLVTLAYCLFLGWALAQ